MPDYLSLFVKSGMLSDAHTTYIANEIALVSKSTEGHGIVLSKEDCRDIAVCRNELLVETERIEIGVGAVGRIIEEFCDNGYVDKHNFRDTVEGLLECFYTIKTETEDKLDDDTVIEFLKLAFNAVGGDVSKIYMLEQFDELIKNTLNGKNDKK